MGGKRRQKNFTFALSKRIKGERVSVLTGYQQYYVEKFVKAVFLSYLCTPLLGLKF